MTYAVLLISLLVFATLALHWGQQAHEHAEETRQARGALAHKNEQCVRLSRRLLEVECDLRIERTRWERAVLAEIDRDLTRLFGEGSA
jgi:hypothetical protein